MKRLSLTAAFVVLFLMASAPAALAAPADGNGKKEVEMLEFLDIPIFCDDTDEIPDLWLDFTGFIQFKQFDGEGTPNLELTVFHLDRVFSNDDGETWTWRDRGPDRIYLDNDGNVILTITGRSGVNNIGHVVFNLTTGEVLFQAGRAPFGGELFEKTDTDFACETLIG